MATVTDNWRNTTVSFTSAKRYPLLRQHPAPQPRLRSRNRAAPQTLRRIARQTPHLLRRITPASSQRAAMLLQLAARWETLHPPSLRPSRSRYRIAGTPSRPQLAAPQTEAGTRLTAT